MAVLLRTLTSLVALWLAEFGASQIVSSPPAYTVLSGPLVVVWSLQPGRRVTTETLELYKSSDDPSPVAAAVLPANASTGTTSFECGLLREAGEYFLQLTNGGKSSLARSKVFSAVWPKLFVTLPQDRTAQSLPHVQAQISGEPLCQLPNRGRYQFWIELWQLAATGINSAEITKWLLNPKPTSIIGIDRDDDGGIIEQAAVLVYRSTISVANLTSRATAVPLHCELFDVAGYYQLVLKVSNSSSIIATSNIMTVSLGDFYRLSSNQTSIFPCFGSFIVQSTKATCPSPLARDDVIRLYALRPTGVQGSAEHVYLYERRASSSTTAAVSTGNRTPASVVSFSCNDIIMYHMDNHATETYCFKYLTVSAHGLPPLEQSTLCLPINASVSAPVDGQWSDWSEWTSCSAKCSPGQQSRHRYCNRPAPSAGGRLCPGNSVQWQACGQPCSALPQLPPAAYLSSLATVPAGSYDGSASGNRQSEARQENEPRESESGTCSCGCKLSQPSGTIVFTTVHRCAEQQQQQSSAAAAASPLHLTWLVQAPLPQRAQVSVAVIAFNPSSSCSLRIRDGPDPSHRLLAASNAAEAPVNVTSSGPLVQVELSVGAGGYGDKSLAASPVVTASSCAFTIYYESQDTAPTDEDQQAASAKMSTSMSSSNLIIIIGCSVGGALTITFIAVAVFLRRRCLKKADLALRTDVKDGVTVVEADESNINHLQHQVHNGRYIHFKHELPSELATPCDEQAANTAESLKHEKRARVRLDATGTRSPKGAGAGVSLPRSTTLPNSKSPRPLQQRTGVTSAHHRSMSMLPDPYHIRPEDFVHPVDLLHSSRHASTKESRAAAEHEASGHAQHKHHKGKHRHDDSHGRSGAKKRPDRSSGHDRAPLHTRHSKRKQSRQSSVRAKASGAPEEETLLALSGASSSSPAVVATTLATASPRTVSHGHTAPDASANGSCVARGEDQALLASLPPPLLESSG